MPLNFRQCAMLVGLSGFLMVVLSIWASEQLFSIFGIVLGMVCFSLGSGFFWGTTEHGKRFRMKYLGAKE